MRSIIILMSFILVCSSSFAQNVSSSDTTKKNQKNAAAGKTPKQDPQQAVHITPGASGVKRSIGYKFSSLNQESDPGNGRFRCNNQSASSVTFIYADNNDISGEDQTNWYSTWDKTTGASGRGRVTVTDNSGKVVAVFDFTATFSDMNGFWKLPVRYVSGSLPADGTLCYYVFDRIAHDEPAVAGNQGNQANQAGQAAVAVVATEAVVPAQTVSQQQAVQTVQVNQVKDTAKVIQANQAGQAAVAVVATEAVVPAQRVSQQQAVQVAQVNQVTDTVKVNRSNQSAAAVVATGVAVNPQAGNQTRDVRTSQGQQVAQATTASQTKPSTPAAQKEQPQQNVTQTNTAATKPTTTQQGQTTKVNNASQTSQVTTTTTGTYWVGNSQTTTASQPARTTPSNQSLYPSNFGAQSTGGARRKWYSGIIEVGYGFGLGNYGQNNFKFNFINGFRIGRFASLGLGIGYRHLFTENKAEPYIPVAYQYIPVFIDFRTTFTSKTLTPYMAVGFGSCQAYNKSESAKDGLLFNASGGIWYNVSKRFAVFGGIVYEMTKLEFAEPLPGNSVYQKNSNSIGINVGISF